MTTTPEPEESSAADYYLGRPQHEGCTWIGSTDSLGELSLMAECGLLEARDVMTGATAESWQETVESVLTDLAGGLLSDPDDELPIVSFPAESYDRLVGHGDEGFRAGWPWHPATSSISTAWAYCYESASVYVYRRGILYATVHLNRARGGYGTPAPFPRMSGER